MIEMIESMNSKMVTVNQEAKEITTKVTEIATLEMMKNRKNMIVNTKSARIKIY